MTRASRPSAGRVAAIAALLVSVTTGIVHASSADAWEEFQQDVKAKCLRASTGILRVTSIQVDPYGSETYGFAVVFGVEPHTSKQSLIACAYDKQSQTVEISSVFDR